MQASYLISDNRPLTPDPCFLDFAALEQLVLLPARALGALEAAHQQKRDPYRDHKGQEICIRRKPMCQNAHKLPTRKYQLHHTASSPGSYLQERTPVCTLEACLVYHPVDWLDAAEISCVIGNKKRK